MVQRFSFLFKLANIVCWTEMSASDWLDDHSLDWSLSSDEEVVAFQNIRPPEDQSSEQTNWNGNRPAPVVLHELPWDVQELAELLASTGRDETLHTLLPDHVNLVTSDGFTLSETGSCGAVERQWRRQIISATGSSVSPQIEASEMTETQVHAADEVAEFTPKLLHYMWSCEMEANRVKHGLWDIDKTRARLVGHWRGQLETMCHTLSTNFDDRSIEVELGGQLVRCELEVQRLTEVRGATKQQEQAATQMTKMRRWLTDALMLACARGVDALVVHADVIKGDLLERISAALGFDPSRQHDLWSRLSNSKSKIIDPLFDIRRKRRLGNGHPPETSEPKGEGPLLVVFQ